MTRSMTKSHKQGSRKPDAGKVDIAASITNAILARLEAGTKPWVRPWTGQAVSRPLRHCGAAYRGINTLLLWMTAEERGYASPYWMTYRQAEIFGGQVRKGEKCTHAVYYKTLSPAEARESGSVIDHISGGNLSGGDAAGPDSASASDRVRRLMRSYAVFNADQIDNLPDRYLPIAADTKPIPPSQHRAKLEQFFGHIPASVRHNGSKAYYNVTRDEIVLPPLDQFASYEGYASVRLHETGHWTGATHRLDRTFGKRFGDDAYAMEELVADITAAIVGAALGLPEAILDNHAAYVGHWVKILRGDKTAILTAASKADEAADFILGCAQGGMTRIIEREPQLLAA